MSPRRSILRFCIILLMAATLIGAGPRRAFSGEVSPGGVITVDSFLDIDDNAPNSICSAGEPQFGPCTLRAAIYEASENVLSKNIVIKLPAGEYKLTKLPDFLNVNDNHTGDLKIGPYNSPSLYSITIEPLGSGPVVIRSMVEDRILTVGANATFSSKISPCGMVRCL